MIAWYSHKGSSHPEPLDGTYPNGLIELDLLFISLVSVKGVETNIVEHNLFANLEHTKRH